MAVKLTEKEVRDMQALMVGCLHADLKRLAADARRRDDGGVHASKYEGMAIAYEVAAAKVNQFAKRAGMVVA